eukprot:CAMPEP_0198735932 /NCGR_PEP_ID=MMETSP1475-20131203/62514_1 /TAXON_ID= ORGANISM="Unidentified sp., Strain CCMP1999" /NCGR_SAMPLE_ID=MMETSP1475 /ASSEMBLY_ACC=CAM_ASM_001111 /LENGTH=171 /DNA_ID=CAMNT_0044499667 /DNA_START=1164 /DNA_END=1679 /DNA_ORIENTATION=-
MNTDWKSDAGDPNTSNETLFPFGYRISLSYTVWYLWKLTLSSMMENRSDVVGTASVHIRADPALFRNLGRDRVSNDGMNASHRATRAIRAISDPRAAQAADLPAVSHRTQFRLNPRRMQREASFHWWGRGFDVAPLNDAACSLSYDAFGKFCQDGCITSRTEASAGAVQAG